MDIPTELMRLKGRRTWAQYARDADVTQQTLRNLRSGRFKGNISTLVKLGIVVDGVIPPLDTRKHNSCEEKEAAVKSLLPQRKVTIQLAKALYEARPHQKQNRKFVDWLRSNMPPRTGYRLIEAWKRLLKFSPVVAERAAANNIPLIGATKSSPYGKYSKIVPLMPPPPKKDPVEADRWLAELETKYRQMNGSVGTIRELINKRDKLNREIAEFTRRRDALNIAIETLKA